MQFWAHTTTLPFLSSRHSVTHILVWKRQISLTGHCFMLASELCLTKNRNLEPKAETLGAWTNTAVFCDTAEFEEIWVHQKQTQTMWVERSICGMLTFSVRALLWHAYICCSHLWEFCIIHTACKQPISDAVASSNVWEWNGSNVYRHHLTLCVSKLLCMQYANISFTPSNCAESWAVFHAIIICIGRCIIYPHIVALILAVGLKIAICHKNGLTMLTHSGRSCVLLSAHQHTNCLCKTRLCCNWKLNSVEQRCVESRWLPCLSALVKSCIIQHWQTAETHVNIPEMRMATSCADALEMKCSMASIKNTSAPCKSSLLYRLSFFWADLPETHTQHPYISSWLKSVLW